MTIPNSSILILTAILIAETLTSILYKYPAAIKTTVVLLFPFTSCIVLAANPVVSGSGYILIIVFYQGVRYVLQPKEAGNQTAYI